MHKMTSSGGEETTNGPQHSRMDPCNKKRRTIDGSVKVAACAPHRCLEAVYIYQIRQLTIQLRFSSIPEMRRRGTILSRFGGTTSSANSTLSVLSYVLDLARQYMAYQLITRLTQSALLAGVLTSTGSWPTILTNGKQSPWFVRLSWYCGIILSLLSIISAADQTVRLHRLSSHRDGLANIHKLLSKGSRMKRETSRRVPSLLQIMTWQMPVMFLITATVCMVVGMFLLVWSATSHLNDLTKWDDQNKVCVWEATGFRCADFETGCCDLHCCFGYCYSHILCGADFSILAN
jgi:hypothetical protein